MAKQHHSFQPQKALISVSDKRDLHRLGQKLHQAGVEILATGNTAEFLKKKNIPVTEISDYTKFPEIMDGRVKTLHPAVHAGILARGSQDDAVLAEHQFQKIDLLIVNLYPFEQIVSDPKCDFAKAIEHIDIGGPAMLRAAAKNHAHTHVIVSPEDYKPLYAYLQKKSAPVEWAFSLAKKAFAHTAAYDASISNYLGTLNNKYKPSGFPEVLTRQFIKKTDLRYGENPHQQAAFYSDTKALQGTLAGAQLLQGKQLSYNNLLDADAACHCIQSFGQSQASCVIIKHNNPCGIAIANTPKEAYQRAFQADSKSAFGGIIAFNQSIDEDLATAILNQQFVEVIIAPEIQTAALNVFKKKENIRLLETGSFDKMRPSSLDIRQVSGGLLVQEHDGYDVCLEDIQVVTENRPDQKQMDDLLFAWKAVKHVKSNAIVYAKERCTIGIGAGQSSRVMSAHIGLMMAKQYGLPTQGAVMASDAFLPFPDTLEIAAEAGITAVIQPGGSIRDEEIIQAANRLDLCMLFTGLRHFKH